MSEKQAVASFCRDRSSPPGKNPNEIDETSGEDPDKMQVRYPETRCTRFLFRFLVLVLSIFNLSGHGSGLFNRDSFDTRKFTVKSRV